MRTRVLLFTLVVLVAACGGDDSAERDDTGRTTTIPPTTITTTTASDEPAVGSGTSEPPWGLTGVPMPDDADVVSALFTALPERMAGFPRADVPGRFPGALGVEYGTGDGGQPLTLRATPMSGITGAGAGDMTAVEWLEAMTSDLTVEHSSLGGDADLAWVAARTEADGETVYLALWCLRTGSWYFDAVADTPEDRALLVDAFVTAARDG